MEAEDDDGTLDESCERCGHRGLVEYAGYFYCPECYVRAEGLMCVAVNDKLVLGRGNCDDPFTSWSSKKTHSRKEPCPEELDCFGLKELRDFRRLSKGGLNDEGCCRELRVRYALGLQWLIQLQCEALVNMLDVCPLVCVLAETIWFRFLANSPVFKDGWVESVMSISNDMKKDCNNKRYQRKAALYWLKHLKEAIPLDSSLAVIFLACHAAREAILPTDISKFSLEGKIPYFAAHLDIQKRFQQASLAFPVSSDKMFIPNQTITPHNLEIMAASIACSIGMNLLPINFHSIAFRFLQQLSLPTEKILPFANSICNWSLPPDLWLSSNSMSFPSRVCAMSLLIVTIRILGNMNGFGIWEKSLNSIPMNDAGGDIYHSHHDVEESNEVDVNWRRLHKKLTLDYAEILRILEEHYNQLSHTFEFDKDLTAYLRYCKDVVFTSSSLGVEEQELAQKMWDFYNVATNSQHLQTKNEEEAGTSQHAGASGLKPRENERVEGDRLSKAVEDLKADMEENNFCYLSPRRHIKKRDYLLYSRKRDDGTMKFAAHADYYLLLRSCARVAEIDIRTMHLAVLNLEWRLEHVEKCARRCLKQIG